MSSDVVVIKEGHLWHYKHRIFGADWTEAFCRLHNDSYFVCFEHLGDSEPAGTIVLRSVAPLICIGNYTDQIPNRPNLPDHLTVANLIAVGTGDGQINWFAAGTQEEFSAWWTAIVSTLPPPPSAPPAMPQRSAPYPVQPQMPPSTTTVVVPTGPVQPPPTHTTVIVAGGRPAYDDDFTTGLIVGSSIGRPWGWGWGFDPHCHHWRFDSDSNTIVNETNVTNVVNTDQSDGGYQGGTVVDESDAGRREENVDVVDYSGGGDDGDTTDAPDDTYDAGGNDGGDDVYDADGDGTTE